MDFLKIIREGRVEDFQNKFSQKFSKEQLERITKLFLPKYLNWVGKNLDAIGFDEKVSKLSNAVKKFDSISSNLPITDLYQYKSEEQLYSALEEYQNKQKRVVRQVEGGNVVFENDKFFVVNPLNHNTSCYYGKGTKWCTAAETDYQFNKYNEDGKLFLIIIGGMQKIFHSLKDGFLLMKIIKQLFLLLSSIWKVNFLNNLKFIETKKLQEKKRIDYRGLGNNKEFKG
jgi:hypothetical protein